MNERKLLRAVWVEVVDDMKYLIKVIDVDPIQQRLWFVPSLVGVLYAYYNTISDSFDDLCSSKLVANCGGGLESDTTPYFEKRRLF